MIDIDRPIQKKKKGLTMLNMTVKASCCLKSNNEAPRVRLVAAHVS